MKPEPLVDITNINEKIYHFLRERIINLTYPPGHRLNVRQLRKYLGVSQTPIKDALNRLAGQGLVEISSRRGTYVKEVTKRDVAEIFDTRIILECGAVEIIANHITNKQFAELKRLYNKTIMEDAEADYSLFMERENDFHLAIFRFTNNKRLLSLYKQLNAHIQIVRFRFAHHGLKRLPKTNKEHEGILEALKTHDLLKAKEAMKYHLLSAKTSHLTNKPNV